METTTYVELNPTMFVQWHKRLLNLVIDIVMLCVIIIILGVIAGILALAGYDGFALWFDNMDGLTDRVFTITIFVVYLFTMELLTQRTVGKYITGTMVVSEDGSKPSTKAIMTRALCRIISFEAFSFLGSYPRGWHDNMSNTYVVDAKKYKEALNVKSSFEQIGLEEA